MQDNAELSAVSTFDNHISNNFLHYQYISQTAADIKRILEFSLSVWKHFV